MGPHLVVVGVDVDVQCRQSLLRLAAELVDEFGGLVALVEDHHRTQVAHGPLGVEADLELPDLELQRLDHEVTVLGVAVVRVAGHY